MVNMDFEVDPLIQQIARQETKETFGLIICALFHLPKPVTLAEFYHQFIGQLETILDEDERQSIYLYPITSLHITIATLYNFKHPQPSSPEKCLNYWKQHFSQLNEQYERKKPIHLTLNAIRLSSAAGFFQFQDEHNSLADLRESIRHICIPEDGQAPLHIPTIVHTSFLRFKKKPLDPIQFENKFKHMTELIPPISISIDEICMALENRPYMHVPCDEAHIVDIMKC